ncbi:hypothetical protein OCU04_012680 [Sclerotinia nivalis]|uniref:PQ loop repeat protein n=1 Tax=Sclerotinia nivalis TaxID=352851 RepID=A0A9X0A973_9HELO|nr:hypothetical protein OCU04_012680 [Sclerotinia nivalis]
MIWAVIIGLSISITVSSSTSNTKLLSILSPLLNKIIILSQVYAINLTPLFLVLKDGIWYKTTFNTIFACFTIVYIILAVLGISFWSLPEEFLFLAVTKLWLLLTSYDKRSGRNKGSHNVVLPGLILDITTNILACGGSVAIIGYFDQRNGPGSLISTKVYILLAGLFFVRGILGELWRLWKVRNRSSVFIENQEANIIIQGQLETLGNDRLIHLNSTHTRQSRNQVVATEGDDEVFNGYHNSEDLQRPPRALYLHGRQTQI